MRDLLEFIYHRFVQLPAKMLLMYRHDYYRTMSGGWRDGHMMNFVSKSAFHRMSLSELGKELANG